MLLFDTCKPFFRLVAVITILTFSPSAIGVWNALPLSGEAESEETGQKHEGQAHLPPASAPSYGAHAQTADMPGAVELLSDEEMGDTKGSQTDAASLLFQGDAYRDQGDYVNAALTYLKAADSLSSGSGGLIASDRLGELARIFREGKISQEAVAAFEASLPPIDRFESLRAKYHVVEFRRMKADALNAAGDSQGADSLYGACMEEARALMDVEPNNGLQIDIAWWYYEAARRLGGDALAKAGAEFQRIAGQSENSLVKWVARYTLSSYFRRHNPPNRLYLLHEMDSDIMAAVLTDKNVEDWVKAELETLFGNVYLSAGRFDDAITQYERVFTMYPACHSALEEAGYMRTLAIENIFYQDDPDLCIDTYLDYAEKHPKSDLAPHALSRAAGIYLVNKNYAPASSLYRDIIKRFPGTSMAAVAENELDFMMAYLVDTWEIAGTAESGNDQQTSNLCGPIALQKLLSLRGIDSTVPELAELAEANDDGTTMLGLARASEEKGLALTGVQAAHPTAVKVPFIAHLDENHFVLVTGIDDHNVTFSDVHARTKKVSLADFADRWNGKALVLERSTTVTKLLEEEAMKTAAGRWDLPPAIPESVENPPANYPDCPASMSGQYKDCSLCGQEEGDFSDALHSPPLYPFYSGTGASGASNVGLPTYFGRTGPSSTVVLPGTSPGASPKIDMFNTSVQLTETDFSWKIPGAMTLRFEREYHNERGFPRSGYLGTDNVIGMGWTHSFNLRAALDDCQCPSPCEGTTLSASASVLSGAGGYARFDGDSGLAKSVGQDCGVEFEDVPAHISSTGPAAGATLDFGYICSSGAASTGYVLETIDGLEHVFNGLGRLTKIRSRSSYTTTSVDLYYDAGDRLTKVASSSGGVYLKLHYDGAGTVITKAQLWSSSQVLQEIEYEYAGYAGDSELTKVKYPDNTSVQYAYASDASAPASRFLTRITDRRGNDTDFSWTFGDIGNGDYEAYKIDVDTPDGLRTTIDRSISTSVTAVTCTKNSTLLRKIVYTPANVRGSRITDIDFYDSASTYRNWKYTYDGSYNLVTVVGPGDTEYARFTYTGIGRISTATYMGSSGLNTTWSYGLDTDRFPFIKTHPDGTVTQYGYSDGKLMTLIPPSAYGTSGYTYQYDNYANLITMRTPMGAVTAYAYDSQGQVTSVTDPEGNTTAWAYDLLGRMTLMTNPLNKTTTFEYAGSGCAGCGGAGWLTKVTDPENNSTSYRYDVNGNLTLVTDAVNRSVGYAYDAMNRLTQVAWPSGSGNTASYAYDGLGALTSVADFEGRSTTLYYDFCGRMTKTSDPVGNVQFTYDSHDNLSTLTDGEGNTTTWYYGTLNELLWVRDDQTNVATHYTYETNGRLSLIQGGGGFEPLKFVYQSQTGLLQHMEYDVGGGNYSAYYYFDNDAQLTRIVDWLGGTGIQYAYNLAGRITQVKDHDGSSLDYTYDAGGNLLTMNDYHSNSTYYTYTDSGRVSTVTAPGSKTWTLHYNALGQATRVDIPNGMNSLYAFDSLNRLTRIEHMDGSSVLDGFAYDLDDNGNILGIDQADGSEWDYEYDGRSRLTQAERFDTDGSTLLHRFSYTYDDADNLLTKAIYDAVAAVTTSTAFEYNGTMLTKSIQGATQTTFAYDPKGRMTSKSDGTYSATYAYRYDDKLCFVTSDFPDEGNVSYTYGSDGKRRSRTAGGTTTRYRWDVGWNMLNEEDNLGNLTRTHVMDSPLAEVANVLADVAGTNPATGAYRYYGSDHLGSTRGLYDGGKSALGGYEYTPYGEVYANSGSVALEGLAAAFTGKPWDAAAQMYYFPYRWYSPSSARWLTRDPLGMVDGPNVYGYVSCGPVRSFDPLGLLRDSVSNSLWVNLKETLSLISGTWWMTWNQIQSIWINRLLPQLQLAVQKLNSLTTHLANLQRQLRLERAQQCVNLETIRKLERAIAETKVSINDWNAFLEEVKRAQDMLINMRLKL